MENKIVYDYREYPVEIYFEMQKRFTLNGIYETDISDEKEYIREFMYSNGIPVALDKGYELHYMFKGTKVYGFSLRKALQFKRNN